MAKETEKEIAHHIFSGSTTMIGVCVTVIALFKITNTNFKTYSDEILGIDTLIYISAAFMSYLVLKDPKKKKLERVSDILFFSGMIIMLMVGLLIIFSAW